jgi:A/G-specific adenine glycosylase
MPPARVRQESAWPVALPDASWKQRFRRSLLAWYRRHARDLPWRRTRDPYAVWISEIMLQQTQVSTVVAYFQRFMAAFPAIDALAGAPEAHVLRLWEGLGYYRRARQLHAAAGIVARDFAGRFPRSLEDVRRLPGIGRYTAGAILSIAFDARHPILEANTFRLLSRLVAYRGDPQSSAGQRLLWHLAEDWLPLRNSGMFNQALMELGSTVCTPRNPACDRCPVRTLCRTAAQGLQEEIPPPRAKPRIEAVREAAVVVRRGQHVLLVERPQGERWAGLWDFPRFSVAATSESAVLDELAANVARLTNIGIGVPAHLATLKHGVTRFRITLDCYMADYRAGSLPTALRGRARWLKPAELVDYPLSVTGRKIAELIRHRAEPVEAAASV